MGSATIARHIEYVNNRCALLPNRKARESCLSSTPAPPSIHFIGNDPLDEYEDAGGGRRPG